MRNILSRVWVALHHPVARVVLTTLVLMLVFAPRVEAQSAGCTVVTYGCPTSGPLPTDADVQAMSDVAALIAVLALNVAVIVCLAMEAACFSIPVW